MQPLDQLLLVVLLAILVDPHCLAKPKPMPKLNLTEQVGPQQLVAELPIQDYPKTWVTQRVIAIHLVDCLSPIAPTGLK